MAVLPKLEHYQQLNLKYEQFLSDLKKLKFEGDIHKDMATRLSISTDNSVYQVIPEVVLFPKHKCDIELIFKLAADQRYRMIKLSPRGGGTGTNGQSLSHGIIIDHSRYLNQIGEINIEERWVEVQPGVVLDQLNDYLKQYQLFFPISISPSDRATLGGMCNTDACGKGSCRYGRTSQNIIQIECVLVGGSCMLTKEIDMHQLNDLKSTDSQVGKIYKTVDDILFEHKAEIEKIFPKLQRFMTGYNLAMIYDQTSESFNLNYLLSGSEGTLAYVTKLRLKLTPIARHKALFVIQYTSFDRALRAARELLPFNPSAIETVDDMILTLAEQDEFYHKIKPLLSRNKTVDVTARGLNLVEFITETEVQLKTVLEQVNHQLLSLSKNDEKIISFFVTSDVNEMNQLWDLRKKSVGLLANFEGWRKPVPFMEDTVVAPEYLADFILALREILDSYHLRYGMFGHVDVGCLHMRPALDMTDKEDQKKLVEITQKVNQLVLNYGGIYWSEHGKGFRSELVKDYFGDILTKDLAKIKKVFDPFNQLNPGKIVVAEGSNEALVKIDGPFRGYADAQVTQETRSQWGNIFNCNGNARCLNRDYNFLMCPSAKISNNWVYSPKGRATLLREWSRLAALKGYDAFKFQTKRMTNPLPKLWRSPIDDFSYEVYQSMQKCLGCKACATSCPVQVDIPQNKSLFLYHYHQRYKRPIKDYFIGYIEQITALGSKLPRIYSTLTQNRFTRKWLQSQVGLVDLPSLSQVKFDQALKMRNAPVVSQAHLNKLTAAEKERSVCLLQDAFTSYYDVKTALTVYDVLTELGFNVYVLPFKANGKGLYVKGFLKQFKRLAVKNSHYLNEIAQSGVDIVGIEPTMVLCYRDEYPKILADNKPQFNVQLLQEWLLSKLAMLKPSVNNQNKTYYLFAHCTERALALTSSVQWQKIFEKLNLKLEIVDVGCCGMAGTYGHEREHKTNSQKLYQLSWREKIEQLEPSQILVSGYSCRSQIRRFSQLEVQHPISVLIQ
ncbi:FAD-binding oxidoreductase [Thiotrichales bacterium 19S3-7]|nr:FAD-binding oxidoreductase [Thiotrichales bacterium 19S3-7]MCF6800820.1 FAD-binding oxidoreductase [Thiotrichales bacterium 19S3-11]